MDTRASARPAGSPRYMALLLATFTAGCDPFGGIDDPPQEPRDGSVPVELYAVRGTASGLGGSVTLLLRSGSVTESLALAGDGAFAFAKRLGNDDAYVVSLADPSLPCTLQGGAGVIAGGDVAVELACTGVSLASLVVSGAAGAIELAPGITDYAARVPLAQASATVTATAATPGATLTIAGVAVDSGVPSAPLALALGANPIDIVVENSHGWRRAYRLTLNRAAEIVQVAYIKASNSADRSLFGLSVSLSGDTLAVGGHYEDFALRGAGDLQTRGDNEDEIGGGSAYVFRRSAGVWREEAFLESPDPEHDHFGYSVAISGDGLAVGAERGDVGEAEHAGAVYVFRRSGGAWALDKTVTSDAVRPYEYFGSRVALAGDLLEAATSIGNVALSSDTLVRTEWSAVSDYLPGSGYVYRRSGDTWTDGVYLEASNRGDEDAFGYSVAVSGDTVVIGAFGEDSAATGVGGDQSDDSAEDSGAVYVFRRADTGWQQEAYLKASNTDAGDMFGLSVAIAGDVIAVGAPGESSAATGVGGDQGDDSAPESGAVYLFRRSGTVWRQEAYVKASNTGAGDVFGGAVALTDGLLAVGAREEDGRSRGINGDPSGDDENGVPASGAVYVFELR